MSNEVVRRFVDRVRVSARSHSKTLSMTMDEAQDLGNTLALMLLRENELLRKIHELQQANEVTEIVIGGGTFK